MFLKSLQISNIYGLIRDIKFHAGLNLIVDETQSDAEDTTGNNVGKTTVLVLIDFCLGASAKGIYTDPENKKLEYVIVRACYALSPAAQSGAALGSIRVTKTRKCSAAST